MLLLLRNQQLKKPEVCDTTLHPKLSLIERKYLQTGTPCVNIGISSFTPASKYLARFGTSYQHKISKFTHVITMKRSSI